MSLNILMSYHYLKNTKDQKSLYDKFLNYMYKNDLNFIIDSGAFSANSLGITIDINEYIKYLEYVDSLGFPFYAIHLDVIGNGQKTYDNMIYMMEKCHLNNGILLPVIQRASSLEIIEKMICLPYNYFCLGGVRNDYEFIKYMIKKYPHKKFHGLAFVKLDKQTLPFSADSSSFNSLQRFGRFAYFNKKRKKFESLAISNQKNLNVLKERYSFVNNTFLNNGCLGTVSCKEASSHDFVTVKKAILPRLQVLDFLKAFSYFDKNHKFYFATQHDEIDCLLSMYMFAKKHNLLEGDLK